MKEISTEGSRKGMFIVEDTKTGQKTLKYLEQNKQIYIHSKYNPVDEANRWSGLNYKKGKLTIVIGFGLGYHISSFINRMVEDEFLLVIEPSEEVFGFAKQWGMVSEAMKHQQVRIVVNNYYVLENIIEDLVSKGCFENPIVEILPGYERIFTEEIQQIREQIKECFMSMSIRINTISAFALSWQQNYLKNLKFALRAVPFKEFENKFSIPVVIVAGGPSLVDDIEKLANVRQRAIIISAGSAITSLERFNIQPDIIVSVDGGIPNYNHFKSLKNKNIPLFFSPTINHKILEEYPGEKVVFMMEMGEVDRWYIEVLGDDPGFVEQGPSVANISLDIATRISSGPICLLGQDLGYTNGVSHAEGNIHRTSLDQMRSWGRVLVKTDSNDGSELYTDYVYLNMKRWFEWYLTSRTGYVVYNATVKGARIKGAEVMPFERFITEFCNKEVDVESTIKDILNPKVSLESTGANEIFSKSISSLERLEKICQRGKEKSEKLLRQVTSIGYSDEINQLLLDLEDIDNEVVELEEKDELLFFLKLPLLNRICFWQVPEDLSSLENRIKVAEKNLFFYEQLHLITKEAYTMLKEIEGIKE